VDVESYLRLCAFLLLPILYLMHTDAAAALFVGCMVWSGARESSPPLFAILGTLGVTPYLLMRFRRTDNKLVSAYLSILLGALCLLLVFKLTDDWFEHSTFQNLFFVAGLALLALDAALTRWKGSEAFLPVGLIGTLIVIGALLATSTTSLYMPEIDYRDISLYSMILVVCVAFFYAFVRFFKKPFSPQPRDAVALCAILGFPLFWIVSNILLLALGVALILFGAQRTHLSLVNSGMLVLISVILIRFFDSELGLLGRGIVFILVGIGFILTNLVLSRKWARA
jgi:hypothetical protein